MWRKIRLVIPLRVSANLFDTVIKSLVFPAEYVGNPISVRLWNGRGVSYPVRNQIIFHQLSDTICLGIC